mgnify:CR=1 FL=1
MNKKDLVKQIKKKQSFLCVGLDKMLERDDGMIEFDYDEDSLTHDNLMKSGRYRKFYSCKP